MSESYIVVFKDSATDEQIQKYINDVNNTGGSIKHQYDSSGIMKGFAASITGAGLQQLQSQSLQDGGIIDYIERDSVVTTQ